MERARLEELLNMYYNYDSGLMRQIVGRQLSRGLRKDLDELTLDEKLSWVSDESDNLESFSVEAHPSTMAHFNV